MSNTRTWRETKPVSEMVRTAQVAAARENLKAESKKQKPARMRKIILERTGEATSKLGER